ncbi:hypothetical protein EN41_27140 [Agrobacterium tumefaciens]|uniref:Uncharacterized protein n=1 Tax=Agrobacterium fabrum (strain C58 / ATCC 33970) TaxID=176299 RepID=Q8UKS0_AGRFC|nr:hypothetical protein [Agrobacterium fabrum]KEY52885.1 hypothetical protein EN41_27140 [Agrobacterium tumefaciens]AAL45722.1 hypothetical protein Atu5029 [Agrobacterium fabrum str. C58]MCX2875256.1 hypothetical protein [Agrobacterium fabrum]NMV70838.1 hypothetical protein [Agrobacterium fabrum]QQN09193.1 hypothetical protein EML4058_23135 [Agrobacterium fabrum]
MASALAEYFTLNYIGFTVGVLSALFSIYAYVRTRERFGMTYQAFDETIVGGESPTLFDDRIEIRFDDMVIDRVNKTTFWIWNSGNKTINVSDIALHDPLVIALPHGSTILQMSTRSKTLANAVRVNLFASDRVFPTFDFLDPNQGFVCEILHTAEKNSLSLQGTIKGGGKILNYKDRDSWLSILSTLPKVFVNFAGMGFTVLVANLITSPIPSNYELLKPLLFVTMFIVLAGSFFAAVDRLLERRKKQVPPYSLND